MLGNPLPNTESTVEITAHEPPKAYNASIEKPPIIMWPRRLRYAAPLALVLLIIITFMPALDAGLVDWDDDMLLHETHYRTISWESLHWMFTTSYTGHFQPLTWLSYSLDWHLWGRETAGAHMINILLHSMTAILFYFVTRRLMVLGLGLAAKPHSIPIVASSFIAAVFFAIHPLRVESVAWLAERRDCLSAVFYLGSVAAYLRYAQSIQANSSGTYRRSSSTLSYILSIVLCLVSLLAKASAVTLPVDLGFLSSQTLNP